MKENIKELGPDGWPFWFWLILFILWGLMSCSRVHYVPVESVRIDSISIRDTVIERELVPYRDSITVSDTTSYLSNDYAYTWAEWSNGQLHHSLGIHPFAKVRVNVPYFVDRYVYREQPRIVEVEKKLTRWQRFKMKAGGLSIAVSTILFVYIIIILSKRRQE